MPDLIHNNNDNISGPCPAFINDINEKSIANCFVLALLLTKTQVLFTMTALETSLSCCSTAMFVSL
jgi:hypothetical protein